MPDTIRDGTGKGYLVKVGSAQKLDTSARVNDRIYYASRDYGKAFIIQWELTQASGGISEGVGYLTNTGIDRINIKQITLTTEESGMTAFGIWKNPSTLSGGVISEAVNLNFSSNNIASIISMENGDGTSVTITGGSSLYTYRQVGIGSSVVELFDAIILGPNDTIAVKANAATTGTKVRVNIMFAESVN